MRQPAVFSNVDFATVTYAADIIGTIMSGNVVFRNCTFPADVKVRRGQRDLTPAEAVRFDVIFENCTFVKGTK